MYIHTPLYTYTSYIKLHMISKLTIFLSCFDLSSFIPMYQCSILYYSFPSKNITHTSIFMDDLEFHENLSNFLICV